MLDLVIIGAGPAGLTAAIYAKRANLDFIILEKSAPGGQMITTESIENYPGFEKISGADLALSFYNHAKGLGIKITFDEALNIVKNENTDSFIVEARKNRYEAKRILLAMGCYPRVTDALNERKFIGRGISFCATCDGAFYRNKNIVVIGSGISAIQEANFLSTIVGHVTIISKRDVFKADQTQVRSITTNNKIDILYNRKIVEFVGTDRLTGVKTDKELIETNGAFIFIGFNPYTKIVEGLPILNEKKYVVVDENMETCIKGLYSAGDLNEKDVRQILTAQADSVVAIKRIITSLGR